MAFDAADRATAQFAKDLDVVMADLIRRVTNYINMASNGGVIDAAILLNSQAAMIQALEEAGYYELAAKHAAAYEEIADDVVLSLQRDGYPPPRFTTVDALTLEQLAAANVEGLGLLGTDTMDTLRLSLFRNALSGAGFNTLVDEVRSTLDGNLKRYAYTYANTANLQFSGEVARVYGESLGADRWENVGPLDEKTRDVCRSALAAGELTKEQWIARGYWGGTPGGYNCRHQLRPVFD